MTLGSLAAKFFGEGQRGINPDYRSLSDLDLGIDAFWRYLPYSAFDDASGLFFNRGSTGFVLKGPPIPGAVLSDQDKLDTFFSQGDHLGEGTSVQFLLVASPRIQEKLDFWRSYRVHPLFQDMADKRYRYLERQAFDAHYPLREFQVMVSYTVPGVLTSPVEKENLVRIRKTLQGALEKIGLFLTPLEGRGLAREVSSLLSGLQSREEEEMWWSDYEEISRLIPAPDLACRITKDGVYLNNESVIANSFLPRTTPKYWALAHMDKLFGDMVSGAETIPCPFIMHYGFVVCGRQGFEKQRAIAKRESLENSLRSPLGKWQLGLEEDFSEAQEIVTEIQKGERIVDACLSLTTFCAPADLARIQNTVEAIWNTTGWSAKSAVYGHLNLLLGSLPMLWTTNSVKKKTLFGIQKQVVGAGSSLSDLGLTRRTITKESQNLLPLVSEWTGQMAPGIPLQGRRGQIAFWSPFDGLFIPGREFNRPSGNFNFCVTGVSGSGKSFLCNEIITNTIAVGGKAFVLDKGGSFKNLCEAFGGRHITFDFSRAFSLNPFTHIPEGEGREDVKDRTFLFKSLLSVVTQMAFPSGEQDDGEEAFLKEAIYGVWTEKKSKGTIDAIEAHLNRQDDTRARDIARSLIDFTSKGSYGVFFNPPANIDLSNDFIVVETDTLEEPLKSVMVMMVMVQVWQRMIRSDRKAPFLVLIDEAWDLLRGKATGDFIEALALTARKYRCALGVATQSLTHFFKEGSTGPKAAWENSAWKIIFNQESDTLSGLKGHPQLGEYVKNGYREALLRSLQPARRFSEFALFHSDLSGVPLRLFCDPYTTLLYSTNAQEVSMLADLEASGLTLPEAIERLLTDRGRG
jgi:conjugal transfer ATP-binding protein TraC